jgi:hypothetical protein
LPKPAGMEDDDYDSYLLRAQFFNATKRTLEGLLGLAFRKKPFVRCNENFLNQLENVDGKGTSLIDFAYECVKEKLITNWGGVLIDMPVTGDNISLKEADELNLSSYMSLYKAESIINWGWYTNGREKKLKYVIFEEFINVDESDYESSLKTQYRVCELDEDGFYRQLLFNEKCEQTDVVYPKSKKGKFKYIPFKFLSSSQEPEESLLEDLINVNLSHFRKSADLENGAHWTGVPTPYISGATEATEIVNGEEVPVPLKLGGCKVVYLPDPSAKMSYLEFSGQGCNLLRELMKDDEARMAILGAKIIAAEKKGVESAETAQINRASENSVLASKMNILSGIIKELAIIYLEWNLDLVIEKDDFEFKINTDYDVNKMSSQDLSVLVSAWQSGGIAKKDLFDNLVKGEILSDNRTFEDMQAEIDEEKSYNLME